MRDVNSINKLTQRAKAVQLLSTYIDGKHGKRYERYSQKSFINVAPNKMIFNFQNGNWLSTIWDEHTYSDNHAVRKLLDEPPFMYEFADSNLVEVMFKCSDQLHTELHDKYGGDGSVIGYLDLQQWLDIVNKLNNDIGVKNV